MFSNIKEEVGEGGNLINLSAHTSCQQKKKRKKLMDEFNGK